MKFLFVQLAIFLAVVAFVCAQDDAAAPPAGGDDAKPPADAAKPPADAAKPPADDSKPSAGGAPKPVKHHVKFNIKGAKITRHIKPVARNGSGGGFGGGPRVIVGQPIPLRAGNGIRRPNHGGPVVVVRG